ncbi:MAG: CDP-alcohol phosphatidyltransferase family protein [Phaeodactylibacter sp.]|uniref:CDP-alcohol phosphatidyltransferase family protein n=1 Tax=Phaeodactylibacter sp. TaxID=1940289 RepID=UPI0032EECE0C
MKDKTWVRLHAALMLAALIALWWTGRWAPVLLVSVFTFSWLLINHSPALCRLRPFGGYANLITLARWLLLLYVGSSYHQWHDYLIFALLLTIIISDGIDGYLARRYGQSTRAGALLDIETDALMSAVMAGIHYQNGTAGGWILLTGGLRYGYVWALYFLNWEDHEGIDNPHARWIGVVFISSLMSPFVVGTWLAVPALITGSLLVTFSFGYSLWGKRND